MRLSRYFLPVLKETPSEAQIVSHRLMLRAGMIRQEAAGIYAWLPLGLRVLKKIEQIVREEMDRAGAVELLMPTLQLADLWRESGRYDAYGPEMLRITDRHERELLYGPTNEEMITEIFRAYVRSLQGPAAEPLPHPVEVPRRAAAALRRHARARVPDEGRLFLRPGRGRRAQGLQPDVRGLSAHLRPHGPEGHPDARRDRARSAATSATSSSSWPRPARAACSATRRCSDLPLPGRDVDYGGDLQPIVDEWTAPLRRHRGRARPGALRGETSPEEPPAARGIEVGQVFYFGDKYSKPMKAMVAGPDGVERPVQMGSYGVGVSRLVGAIIEASHDDAGIIWPDAVAPFGVGMVNLRPATPPCDAACETAYSALEAKPAASRSTTTPTSAPAASSPRMDLIGLPWQLIIGPKGLADGRGRAEAPRHRRAPDPAPGRGAEALGLRQPARSAQLLRPRARPLQRLGASASPIRYLRAKRKDGGVALISIISFIGITLARGAADHHHVDHERLPRRTARPDPGLQRPRLRPGPGDRRAGAATRCWRASAPSRAWSRPRPMVEAQALVRASGDGPAPSCAA